MLNQGCRSPVGLVSYRNRIVIVSYIMLLNTSCLSVHICALGEKGYLKRTNLSKIGLLIMIKRKYIL